MLGAKTLTDHLGPRASKVKQDGLIYIHIYSLANSFDYSVSFVQDVEF